MRGRKRKLPENYVPPPYIGSSENDDDNAPQPQRQRQEVQQQQQQQQHEDGDDNMWIDIPDELFYSDNEEQPHEGEDQRGEGEHHPLVYGERPHDNVQGEVRHGGQGEGEHGADDDQHPVNGEPEPDVEDDDYPAGKADLYVC